MASLKRKGFGQVEPNHLSAKRTGQIYAQLIAAPTLNIIENGMFLKYDYENREANLTGEGEWLLVYNEEKLYDPRKQSHKDWAMIKKDYVDGEMVPRLFKTNVGDIYTTNCILVPNTADDAETTAATLTIGQKLTPAANGYLANGTGQNGQPTFKIVAFTTMPDGQDAVKLQRIA